MAALSYNRSPHTTEFLDPVSEAARVAENSGFSNCEAPYNKCAYMRLSFQNLHDVNNPELQRIKSRRLCPYEVRAGAMLARPMSGTAAKVESVCPSI